MGKPPLAGAPKPAGPEGPGEKDVTMMAHVTTAAALKPRAADERDVMSPEMVAAAAEAGIGRADALPGPIVVRVGEATAAGPLVHWQTRI